jgi:hypothetical protein
MSNFIDRPFDVDYNEISRGNNQQDVENGQGVTGEQVFGVTTGVLVGSVLLGPLGGIAGAWIGERLSRPE